MLWRIFKKSVFGKPTSNLMTWPNKWKYCKNFIIRRWMTKICFKHIVISSFSRLRLQQFLPVFRTVFFGRNIFHLTSGLLALAIRTTLFSSIILVFLFFCEEPTCISRIPPISPLHSQKSDILPKNLNPSLKMLKSQVGSNLPSLMIPMISLGIFKYFFSELEPQC